MKEKASFGKRALAQLIDLFIVGIIVGIISVGFSTTKVDNLNEEANNLMSDFVNGEVSTSDYINQYASISYDISKASVNSNIVYLVVCVGYFLIFQYLNRGCSIGKKLMGIRIVSYDNSDVSFLQMFIRTSIVNDIIPMLMIVTLVFVSGGLSFFVFYSVISLIFDLFIIICMFMILYRKDRLAINDIMSHSMVIIDR